MAYFWHMKKESILRYSPRIMIGFGEKPSQVNKFGICSADADDQDYLLEG
jgi:hypothetical protein